MSKKNTTELVNSRLIPVGAERVAEKGVHFRVWVKRLILPISRPKLNCKVKATVIFRSFCQILAQEACTATCWMMTCNLTLILPRVFNPRSLSENTDEKLSSRNSFPSNFYGTTVSQTPPAKPEA